MFAARATCLFVLCCVTVLKASRASKVCCFVLVRELPDFL
jgi:hypothetical protein